MNNKVDLSEFNLLIATPQAEGRPHDTYNTSLDNTKQLIRQYGGSVENFKTRGVSDIAFARSKLFGAFYRNKKFTHMIQIDDDQGWEPEDVVWFLLAKRDFLAAAGPKKTIKEEFAFNLLDENGKKWGVRHELDSNITRLPYVGGAFVMISRNCAERMVQSYKELEYNIEDIVEHAIYDPIILNDGERKRRLSEDYAFCHRWRMIGGHVEVKMDVTLQHTGPHTFTGNLYNYFLKNSNSGVKSVTKEEIESLIDGKAIC